MCETCILKLAIIKGYYYQYSSGGCVLIFSGGLDLKYFLNNQPYGVEQFYDLHVHELRPNGRLRTGEGKIVESFTSSSFDVTNSFNVGVCMEGFLDGPGLPQQTSLMSREKCEILYH